MEEKKKKQVNLSTLVCVIIIFILIIALMVVCYFAFLKKDDTNNTNNVTENNNVSKQLESEKKKDEEELKLNSSETEEILKKFNFLGSAHSIYKTGEFDLSSIPNDLILRLGWNKIKSKDKDINERDITESVDKSIMAKSIKNIFGDDITYKDKSFIYGDVKVFSEFITENVNFDNSKYSALIFQGGGIGCPFIHEEVQKVMKSDDKIDVYVKTAFVDLGDLIKDENDSTIGVEYNIYKNYDFNKEEFENKLITVKSNEFDENNNNSDEILQLSPYSNKTISSIINKLDTYKYTFTLDKDSGEYYFTSFNKE